MVQHVAIAIFIQLLMLFFLRSWATGAATACAWSVAREITQAEYRWIELHGDGLRANMPWWGGFDLRVWQSADAWLDWIFPCLAVIVIAFLAPRLIRRDAHSIARRRS